MPRCTRSKYKTAFHKAIGITRIQYDNLLASQDGRCKICLVFHRSCDRALAIDHDHRTGVIRGLLCNRCNKAIGAFEDNPVFLRAAADYIETRTPVDPRNNPQNEHICPRTGRKLSPTPLPLPE